MEKEIRKYIDRVNIFNKLNENSIDFSRSKDNSDKIIDLINQQPNKYKLKTKYISDVLYDNGIDTALNSSRIAAFYLKYYKDRGRKLTILPIPELNSSLYDKLNELIKICDLYKLEDDVTDKPKSLLHRSDNDTKSLNGRLLRANCFQIMNALLYEDYFNVDFRYGNAHKIVNELILPQNEEEFYKLFEVWNNRDGVIRHLLFYADVIPIVSAIEKYF